jgi:hypothetical protein
LRFNQRFARSSIVLFIILSLRLACMLLATQFRTGSRSTLFLELHFCFYAIPAENRSTLFLELLIEVEATGPDGK